MSVTCLVHDIASVAEELAQRGASILLIIDDGDASTSPVWAERSRYFE